MQLMDRNRRSLGWVRTAQHEPESPPMIEGMMARRGLVEKSANADLPCEMIRLCSRASDLAGILARTK